MKYEFKKKIPLKAGMYLLENLTSGMYNEPLSIYREYIQNAVDSIDLSIHKNGRTSLKVDIEIDPSERRITIRDNGIGIPANVAGEILSSIGSSNKTGCSLRGFRGIGRLGGIAFSDKAVFCTKGEREQVESIQEWDCRRLRKLLSDPQKKSLKLEKLFLETTSFYQRKNKSLKDSYFEVSLFNVSSFRNYIFDIERVREYLSQVAPVPFNSQEFSFSQIIDAHLTEKLSHYGKYNINLNGDPVYKPYRNIVKITKKGFDYIDRVKIFEININNEQPIAYGWYGERRDLLGAINKGETCSGIRVRVGNILIGNAHLLDGCFREPRFNSYIIGEIHVDSPDLIPNSRRDDFVDNKTKNLFYNSVERTIGLPISKEIRLRSRMSSGPLKNPSGPENAFESDVEITDLFKKERSLKHTMKARPIPENSLESRILNEMKNTCSSCQNLSKIMSKFSALLD